MKLLSVKWLVLVVKLGGTQYLNVTTHLWSVFSSSSAYCCIVHFCSASSSTDSSQRASCFWVGCLAVHPSIVFQYLSAMHWRIWQMTFSSSSLTSPCADSARPTRRCVLFDGHTTPSAVVVSQRLDHACGTHYILNYDSVTLHYITLHRNYLKSPMVKKLLNDCPM